MALPIAIPNTFATATAPLPLSQLDSNFSLLVNTVNGIGSGTETLATPVITGGTINNATVGATTANTGRFSTIQSTVTTGTAPLIVASTTQVANLNAATAGNALTVTTNANLTGEVTSVGNAATVPNATVIAKVLTGYVSSAGVIAATDSILVAIQKLNGNNATNANLTGPITSVGNATAIALQTGTGTTFVMQASPTLTTPVIGAATGTSLSVSGQLTSTVATGTAPLIVSSTTVVANLNASSLSGATFAAPTAIGSTTASTGAFTTLNATGAVTFNPASAAVLISPTGTGTVTISPVGTLTINPTAASTINNASIGATTASTGTFTTLSATINSATGVNAANSGLTAVTAVAGSLTLATGGVTLLTQTAAAGSVWRVVAYGTYAAASSANVRALTMSCYWGTVQLTAITTGSVLSAVAQTTAWRVEFEISTSSTTAAWNTGVLSSQVTSATIPLNAVSTPASVTVTAGAQTLDFRVGQTGTVTATDIINVHQVILERIK